MHGGRSFAHGRARGHRLRIKLDHLRPGRYQLRVQGRRKPVKVAVHRGPNKPIVIVVR